MTTSIIISKKAIYHLKCNNRSKKKSIRSSQTTNWKKTRQQYHTVFNATKQQLAQSDKGTKKISLENETHHKWSKNITLTVGDSIVFGIEENRISRQWRKVKVKSFPGATIEDMYDCIKTLLKKYPKKYNIVYWGKQHR